MENDPYRYLPIEQIRPTYDEIQAKIRSTSGIMQDVWVDRQVELRMEITHRQITGATAHVHAEDCPGCIYDIPDLEFE